VTGNIIRGVAVATKKKIWMLENCSSKSLFVKIRKKI